MSSRASLFGPPPPGGNGDALSAVLENAYNARQAAMGGGGSLSREARWEAARLARDTPSSSLPSQSATAAAAPSVSFSAAPNAQLLLPNVAAAAGPTLADALRSGGSGMQLQPAWDPQVAYMNQFTAASPEPPRNFAPEPRSYPSLPELP